jgi:hypothetical protein
MKPETSIPDNPFAPARLSPLAKPPLACPLPYGLTWDDLQAHLPGYNKHAESQAQAFESYEKQGLHGGANSCILTLTYPVVQNQFQSETIFAKKIEDPKMWEAQKYRFLASHGIPTPNLIGIIQKGETEIIFLEFIPTIGIDFGSTWEVESVLHLAAQLNSLQNLPDFFKPVPGMPKAEFDELVRGVLARIAQDQALPFKIEVSRWSEAFQTVQEACRKLPTALNHNQFFFQQMGWVQRDNTRQLVIFDLETMTIGPRFFDMSTIIDSLAFYSGREPLDLFRIYYDRLCQLTGLEIGYILVSPLAA